MIHYKGEHKEGGFSMNVWIVEVYENGVWRQYGAASVDFKKLYDICRKFCENGTKARVVRVKH